MLTFARRQNEKGAAAFLVAACLLLLLGMAAIAVDLSAGFNERRQDQTAVDLGALSGAVQFYATPPSGTSREVSVATETLAIVRANLDTTYTNAEWQTLWQTCTDPTKNTGQFEWQSIKSPFGGTPTTLDCISLDPGEAVADPSAPTGQRLIAAIRVKLPDQIIEAMFGKVIGTSELTTSAYAIAALSPRSGGGILPFALYSGAADGGITCLSNNSGGTAVLPCGGPSSGNFGSLNSPIFGDVDSGIASNCGGNPANQVLAYNIAAGLDHIVIPYASGVDWTNPANEILDQCSNLFVNTMFLDTGFPSGSAEGLVTGSVINGATPRLQQVPSGWQTEIVGGGYVLEDRPLWELFNFTASNGAPAGLPTSCGGFDGNSFDWDPARAGLEPNQSHYHLTKCLADYVAEGRTAELFSESIGDSSRFSYVPQFFEASPPSGASNPRHVWRFKAVWLQGTWFGTGANTFSFFPGETCKRVNNDSVVSCDQNRALRQMTAYVIPENALPADLRAGAPGTSGANPFVVELFG